MGQEYLIDTNVLIDAQAKRLPENGLRFMAEIIDKNFTISFITYIISFITYIEFLGYKDPTKETEDFIALADMIEMNKNVINASINVRKSVSIKLPDAIIAATALVNDLTLITRNIDDFKNIDGIKLINPWEL
ncbi:MAG: type II toxin-antitoxin system VapC family toxin [Niabella sp.]